MKLYDEARGNFMVMKLIAFHIVFFAVVTVVVVENTDFKRDPSSSVQSFRDPYQFMKY